MRHTPHRKITLEQASPETLGDARTANRRTIHKYIVPTVLPSCQLVMGMTRLADGSVWNTMPCHTHDRRMEVYFYFNLPPDGMVFHLMGRATGNATRRRAQRAGGHQPELVDPYGRRHAGVHVHLGNGRREPGIPRHGRRGAVSPALTAAQSQADARCIGYSTSPERPPSSPAATPASAWEWPLRLRRPAPTSWASIAAIPRRPAQRSRRPVAATSM